MRKNQISYNLLFDILLIMYASLCFALFYTQCVMCDKVVIYYSDMKTYMLQIQGGDNVLLPYPIYFWIGRFFYMITSSLELGMTCATTLLCVLTAIIIKKMVDSCYSIELSNNWVKVVSVFIIFSLLFCQMLSFEGSVKYGIMKQYHGVYSGNPWHNGTFLAARPFMVLTFIWYIKVMDFYEEGMNRNNYKDYIYYSLFLLLSTMTKPSFTFILLIYAASIMIYRMIYSRFKNFKQTFILALFYIPTLVDLLYQYSGVFISSESAESQGIGFEWLAVWGAFTDNILVSILLAIAFPLSVLLFHIVDVKKNTFLKTAWGIYGVGFLTAALLYEKSYRFYHFNFAWGYMCGIFILFLVSAIELLKDSLGVLNVSDAMTSKESKFFLLSKKVQYIILCIEWILFLAHTCNGVIIFRNLMLGVNLE